MSVTLFTSTLEKLYATILERRTGNPEESYVAKLTSKGRKKMAQKLGEEAVETVIDAVANKPEGVVKESADLLFHLLVLWAEMGITPEEIAAELSRRDGISGIKEKNNRSKE